MLSNAIGFWRPGCATVSRFMRQGRGFALRLTDQQMSVAL